MMREFINIVENVENFHWPETIDGYDLCKYAEQWHHTPEDFEDGDIGHNIQSFGIYHLRMVNLSDLELSRYIIFDDLVKDYANRGNNNIPPIIVDLEHRNIIDGNHRANAAAQRGEKTILAYVGDMSTYSPPDDEDDDEWHPE